MKCTRVLILILSILVILEAPVNFRLNLPTYTEKWHMTHQNRPIDGDVDVSDDRQNVDFG